MNYHEETLHGAEQEVTMYRSQGALRELKGILELPAEIREYQRQLRTVVPGTNLTMAKKIGGK